MTSVSHYIHHRIDCSPLVWKDVAEAIISRTSELEASQGALYGIWRSQIGQPRDTLNVMTAWQGYVDGQAVVSTIASGIRQITSHESTRMRPTLRPTDDAPPRRQGNFAFRWFETPEHHWQEFLDLCAEAWPGFESAYDSQVIGLWKVADETSSPTGVVRSLLMTRRPDLAMWERSKIPQGEKEEAVRAKLNRRYDICNSTTVYTTTLLTADDREDRERWT